MSDAAPPQPSPLAGAHEALGARFAPFAGWNMPIQYQGILPEHRAVRESVGVFDISHMGQLFVSGERARAWLNRLLTNDVAALGIGEGQYTLLLNERGGVIDDLILYRIGDTSYLLVVNAARVADDRDWMSRHLEEGIALDDRSADYGAIAIQGPEALTCWEKMRGEAPALPERNGIVEIDSGRLILCRTGYTGEDGFELFAPSVDITRWFQAALEAGATPCGLGARDTLRLEKGYPLNGSDLDPEHTPLEAGLGFFCKLEKPGGFIGSDVLARQKAEGLSVRLAALRLVEKGPPPRHDYPVFTPGGTEALATLTSGSLSPGLGTGIGMAYLPVESTRPGTALEVEIRGRRFPAEVVKKPFV